MLEDLTEPRFGDSCRMVTENFKTKPLSLSQYVVDSLSDDLNVLTRLNTELLVFLQLVPRHNGHN